MTPNDNALLENFKQASDGLLGAVADLWIVELLPSSIER